VRSPKSKSPREGNLVLGRRQGETITLHTSDGDVTIRVKNIKKEQVWLTLNAPKSINIVRSEIDGNDRRKTE
jgi:carbon storage regulator CsrA